MRAAGRFIIPVRSMRQEFTFYCIGDIHAGNVGCAIEHARADVAAAAADPLAYVFGMGDYADYIGPADKRWDAARVKDEFKVKDLADWGRVMAKGVVQLFAPVKKKLIGLIEGNHEDCYERAHWQELHGWVCTELNTQNLGYSCFLDLSFTRVLAGGTKASARRYRVFLHHGAGAAQTPGGKTNRLVNFMTSAEADIYLVGHVHERDPKRIDTIKADGPCRKIVAKKRLGLYTGTYLKTYDEGNKAGYGEKRGYRPVPLGCSTFTVRPFKKAWKQREDSVVAQVII